MLFAVRPPPQEDSDRRLIDAAAAGDAVARDTVADRLEARVRRLARALVGGAGDWEDAAQRSLLEILRSLGSFDGRSSLERWADTITARTTLRSATLERRRAATRDLSREVDELPSGSDPPRVPARELLRYLNRLSEERRTAVVMHHVAGHTVEEVAGLTGVSVNTAKDRLLSGRRELRAMIRREDVHSLTLVRGAR